MKEFGDKVAVITGAASGIGFGIAQRCTQEGMKVVLADINQEDLQAAEQALAPSGATTLFVQADVSKFEEVEALSQKTLDAFGEVHLLVNNAGVGAGGSFGLAEIISNIVSGGIGGGILMAIVGLIKSASARAAT